MKKLEVGIVILLLMTSEPLPFPRFVENIISIISYGFLFLIITGRWKRLIYIATAEIYLLILVSVAIASIFWSANLSNTAYQARLLLRPTLFGVYLAMQYTPREQIRLLSWTVGIIMILSLASSLLFPSYGIQEINGTLAWRGIYTHKQLFGRQMGFAVSLFIINIFDKRSNRWVAIIGLSLGFALILLSKSKSGLIIFLFSLVIIPIYNFNKLRNIRLLLFLTLLLIFSIVSFLVTVNFEYIVVDFLGKDIELNGRLPLWTLAIEKGLEQPWLGYGYRGFWSSDVSDSVLYNSWAVLEEEFRNRTIEFHSHNGFIDLFLELGLIGILIFLLNFFFLIKRVVTLILTTRAIEYFYMLQVAGICWITNISESRLILTSNSTLWIIYVTTVLSSAIEYRRVKLNHCLNASKEALKIAAK
ncbi:O-antigen ligase family protein [Tolypothrix campylonemoides VB511288]|nr:O-antigen ligase family protein [Tolypothrix campylonemoides VB511288]